MSDKKLIVVTGASSGVGYVLAKILAERGHDVLAIARRESLLKELAASDDNIHYLVADIANKNDRQKIVDYIAAQDKPIHLVHNAAIVMPKMFADLTEQDWQQALAINFEGPLWLTQACLPFFEGSRVLHTSSGLAHFSFPGTAAYSLTKAALHMLYQIINTDMDPAKIIAGSIRPGIIDTPMQQQLRQTDAKDLPCKSHFENVHQQNQLRSPEQVAKFMADILLNTDDDTFKAKEWNINTDLEYFT